MATKPENGVSYRPIISHFVKKQLHLSGCHSVGLLYHDPCLLDYCNFIETMYNEHMVIPSHSDVGPTTEENTEKTTSGDLNLSDLVERLERLELLLQSRGDQWTQTQRERMETMELELRKTITEAVQNLKLQPENPAVLEVNPEPTLSLARGRKRKILHQA